MTGQPSAARVIETAGSRDVLYKVLVIGELGTGKTSTIKRYAYEFFTAHYKSTIGVDFGLKKLQWDERTRINLQFWDIAGQERYGNMTHVYYREAAGAVVVFDVTRETTLEGAKKWKADLDKKVHLYDADEDAEPVPIPAILLANKIDMAADGWFTTKEDLDALAKELGFVAAFETSARDDVGIEGAMHALIKTMLAVVPPPPAEDEDESGAVSLSWDQQQKKKPQDEDDLGRECKCVIL